MGTVKKLTAPMSVGFPIFGESAIDLRMPLRYKYLKKDTNKFNAEMNLSRGGSGTIYKGIFPKKKNCGFRYSSVQKLLLLSLQHTNN